MANTIANVVCKGLGRPITDVIINERKDRLMRFPLIFDGLNISI